MNTQQSHRKGSALLMAMIFVLVITIVLAGLFTAVQQETRQTHRARLATNSLEGAKASLDQVSNNIVHVAKTRPPKQSQGIIENLDDLIHDIRPSGIQNVEMVANADGRALTYILDRGPNDFEYREIQDVDDPWDGYTTARLDYEVVSFAREETPVADRLGYAGAGVRRRIVVDYIPLYQFAIFYDNNLELHPGPAMEVFGPVHSNEDLELSSLDKIHFHQKVTSAGRILRFPGQGGDVLIKDRSTPINKLVSMKKGDGWLTHADSDWFEDALDTWHGNVRDKAHGVRPIKPPLPAGADTSDLIQRATSSDDPGLRSVKFEYKADYIISGDPGRPDTFRIYEPVLDEDFKIVSVNEVDSAIVSEVVKSGEFYDGQQATVVRTLDVDMGKMSTLLDFSDSDGIVYVSTTPSATDTYTLDSKNRDPVWRQDATGNLMFDSASATYGQPLRVTGSNAGWFAAGRTNYMPAVRLVNATKVPRNARKGFGLYTDRPVYTAGHVNTTDPAVFVVGGDSVTVTSTKLRLATKDTNSNGVYDSDDTGWITTGHTRDMGNNPKNGGDKAWTNQSKYNWDRNNTIDSRNSAVNAVATTTNMVILGGNAPSVKDEDGDLLHISGGAHNVIRYLENWSGKKHTFKGSIIILSESRLAIRHNRQSAPGWSTKERDYYDAPNRDYSWDSTLKKSEPPPGMPVLIEVIEYPAEPISMDYAIANLPEVVTEEGDD